MSTRNPYSPPAAVVADRQQSTDGTDTLIPNGRSRPILSSWKWIADGWELFKRQPGMWILSAVLFYVVFFLMLMIPFVNFLASLMWPVFMAGFFVMAHMAYRREHFDLSHIFSGFRKVPGRLALIGVVNLFVLFGIGGTLVGGGKWFRMAAGVGNPDLTTFVGMGLAVVIWVLVTVALFIAVAFAPTLVQLNDESAFSAMKMSAIGCLKNILPGILFVVIFGLIFVISVIPVGLGLLITFPLITTTFYSAYRDIFVDSKPA